MSVANCKDLGWSKDPGPTYLAGRLPAILLRSINEVDKKKIVMESIKSAGNYTVEAKLYAGISAKFKLNVESGRV